MYKINLRKAWLKRFHKWKFIHNDTEYARICLHRAITNTNKYLEM